jgi:hypothetical protein
LTKTLFLPITAGISSEYRGIKNEADSGAKNQFDRARRERRVFVSLLRDKDFT